MDESKEQQPSLNNEELLKVVDFEIDRITKEYTSLGWTEWAIYGGFALIFWSIITFSDKQSLSLLNVSQLLVTFYLLYHSLSPFKAIYSTSSGQHSSFLTVNRLSHQFSLSKMFSELVISASLLVISIFAGEGVWWVQSTIVVVWLMLLTLYAGLLLFVLLEDLPNIQPTTELENSSKTRLISFTISAVLAVLILWASSGYFFATFSRYTSGILFEDLKMAGLIFAILFLFEKFFYEPTPRRMLAELVKLRRKISFKEIDECRGFYELKMIFGRLSPSEFLEDSYTTFSADLNTLDFVAANYLTNCKNLINAIDETKASKFDTNAIKENTEKLLMSRDFFSTLHNGMERNAKKFKKEIKNLTWFGLLKLDEVKDIEDELNAKLENINIKKDEIQKLERQINGKISH